MNNICSNANQFSAVKVEEQISKAVTSNQDVEWLAVRNNPKVHVNKSIKWTCKYEYSSSDAGFLGSIMRMQKGTDYALSVFSIIVDGCPLSKMYKYGLSSKDQIWDNANNIAVGDFIDITGLIEGVNSDGMVAVDIQGLERIGYGGL